MIICFFSVLSMCFTNFLCVVLRYEKRVSCAIWADPDTLRRKGASWGSQKKGEVLGHYFPFFVDFKHKNDKGAKLLTPLDPPLYYVILRNTRGKNVARLCCQFHKRRKCKIDRK